MPLINNTTEGFLQTMYENINRRCKDKTDPQECQEIAREEERKMLHSMMKTAQVVIGSGKVNTSGTATAQSNTAPVIQDEALN